MVKHRFVWFKQLEYHAEVLNIFDLIKKSTAIILPFVIDTSNLFKAFKKCDSKYIV